MTDASEVAAEILREPVAGLRGGIAFVGGDIPVDLLRATDLPHGHLPWRAAGETPWADRWLESGFPQWSRYLLEDWRAGRFDDIARVVFSRGDDPSQRLYYYVRELQRRGELAGPEALVFDIALLPRDSSLDHTEQALRNLGSQLGVAEAGLAAGIAQVDALRARLAAWQAGRTGDGAAYERLGRALLFSDGTRWSERAALPPAGADRPRVLLAGSVPPDDRLHRAVEQAGASVVAEGHALETGRLGAPIGAAGEPAWRALARHLRATSTGPRSVIDRAEWIVARARAARAGAVVLWLTREEEALAWHVPAQRAVLAQAGLPCLALSSRAWHADDGAPEQIARFCTETFG